MTDCGFVPGRPPARRRVGRARLAMVALAVLAPPVGHAHAQIACTPCVVGTALDGGWERNREMLETFERQVVALAEPQFEVVFPAAKRRVADATADGVRRAVEASLADPEVDLVLAVGPVATVWAGRRGDLPKPVIGAFAIDPGLQGLPTATSAGGERVSGRSNLSYVTFSSDAAEEIRQFRRVASFTRLTVLAGAPLLEAVDGFGERLQSRLARIDPGGAAVDVVAVRATAAEALAAIPPGAEAIYVTPLLHLPAAEFDALVRGLTQRRLPTFSYMGRREVEAGLLMSLYRNSDFLRLGRRIAVHVQRLLRGEEAGGLPIDFRREPSLALNMATARAVGVHPDWSLLTEAELVHDVSQAVGRRLSLTTAVQEAVAANLDLAADDRLVAAGRQLVRGAQAVRRPQVTLSGMTQQINPDRARATYGLFPAWQAAGSVGASQILYSDAARANVEIEAQRQAGREQSRAASRLDIVHDAAVGYLQVLRAAAFERIQRENLTATRSNRDLARSRRQIGVAGASEVIRWENEIAVNRRNVIDAGAHLQVAAIALNRLLHRPLEEPFGTVETGLDDPGLLGAATFETYAGNPFAFARFRDFLAREALQRAPELQRLDAAIAAGERAVLAARRALRVPQVEARGDVTTLGALELGGLPFQSARRPDRLVRYLNWTAGVQASLPLFEGGARRAARTRARRELDELRLRRRAAAERIEQRIRSAAHLAGASFVGIELADAAADAARSNLALVSSAYEQGAVPMLDLLDAQHAALLAEQEAANAVSDHLIDQMAVQRALGRFRFFMTREEAAAFDARLRNFFTGEAGAFARGRSSAPRR